MVVNDTNLKEAVAVLPMRPEQLKGHLDALLLAVLEPGPQHGYAVIESLRSGSDDALDLPTGTVRDQFSTALTALLTRRTWPATA